MSRIFITGDTHGLHDIAKIDRFNKLIGSGLSKDNYLIIVGDVGVCWIGDPDKNPGMRDVLIRNVDAKLDAYHKVRPEEDLSMIRDVLMLQVEDTLRHDKQVQDFWNKKSWTTLFVDGNHENHAALDSYPVEEWHGGKVHKISDSIIHLMRGQVFNIDGTTFFAFGGAESTDKKYRAENVSWWAREMPSEVEYDEALTNLDKCGGKVDYILTHCAPESTLTSSGMPSMYYRSDNDLTTFFDAVAKVVDYKGWYFGHYHEDCNFDKFHLLFDSVSELELHRDVIEPKENHSCSTEIKRIWNEKKQDRNNYPKTLEISGIDSVMTMHYVKKELEELLFRAPGDGISFSEDLLYVKVNNFTEEDLLKKMMPLYEKGNWYRLIDSCPGDNYSSLNSAVNIILGRRAGFGYKENGYCVYATTGEIEAVLKDPDVIKRIEKIYERRDGRNI